LRKYTTGGRLHMAYTFNLMDDPCSPRFIHGVLQEFLQEAGDAWVCWAPCAARSASIRARSWAWRRPP